MGRYRVKHQWVSRPEGLIQTIKDWEPTGAYVPPLESKSAYVIGDEMGETLNHADGRHYTSKSEFRRATRRAGCIEVGTEKQTATQARPEGVREAALDAYERCEYGKGVNPDRLDSISNWD